MTCGNNNIKEIKMKFSKSLAGILVAVAMIGSMSVEAASFGRASSSSSSSSFSAPRPSPSFTAPAPRPAPTVTAPSPSSGIGGTSGSMGVRKSAVTAPVAAQVQSQRSTPTANASPSTSSIGSSGYTPSPTYAPAPAVQSNGHPFLSSLGGSFAGSMLANSLFNHNNGPAYGSPGGAPVAGAQQAYDASGAPVAGAVYPAPAHSYGIGSFIGDVLLFSLLIAILVGLAYLFYKGYQKVFAYVQQERGIAPYQPFNPTGHFWKIQHAFETANLDELKPLLGPDLVDEATRGLQPSTLNLSKVSHEVVLSNAREFSVHYKFEDAGEPVDQVWHYELINSAWLLNGIETV